MSASIYNSVILSNRRNSRIIQQHQNVEQKSSYFEQSRKSVKEEYFDQAIELAQSEHTKNPLCFNDWVKTCFEAKSATDTNVTHQFLHGLASNDNRVPFTEVVLTRGLQKALALGFILEYQQDAFNERGKFDFDKFKSAISKIIPGDLLPHLNNKYFQHITLSATEVSFGSQHYRNKLHIPLESTLISLQNKLLDDSEKAPIIIEIKHEQTEAIKKDMKFYTNFKKQYQSDFGRNAQIWNVRINNTQYKLGDVLDAEGKCTPLGKALLTQEHQQNVLRLLVCQDYANFASLNKMNEQIIQNIHDLQGLERTSTRIQDSESSDCEDAYIGEDFTIFIDTKTEDQATIECTKKFQIKESNTNIRAVNKLLCEGQYLIDEVTFKATLKFDKTKVDVLTQDFHNQDEEAKDTAKQSLGIASIKIDQIPTIKISKTSSENIPKLFTELIGEINEDETLSQIEKTYNLQYIISMLENNSTLDKDRAKAAIRDSNYVSRIDKITKLLKDNSFVIAEGVQIVNKTLNPLSGKLTDSQPEDLLNEYRCLFALKQSDESRYKALKDTLNTDSAASVDKIVQLFAKLNTAAEKAVNFVVNNYVNRYSQMHGKQSLTADMLMDLTEKALLSHNSTELRIVAGAFNALKIELGDDFNNFTDIDLLHQIFKNQVANPDSSHIWAALFYCVEMADVKIFIDGCGVPSTNSNTIKDVFTFCSRNGDLNSDTISSQKNINGQNYKLDNIENALYHGRPVLRIFDENNTDVFVEVVEDSGQQMNLADLSDKIKTFFNLNREATLLDFFNQPAQFFETLKFRHIWDNVKTYRNAMGQLGSNIESMKLAFISYLARTTQYSSEFYSFLENDEEARQVYLNIAAADKEVKENLYNHFRSSGKLVNLYIEGESSYDEAIAAKFRDLFSSWLEGDTVARQVYFRNDVVADNSRLKQLLFSSFQESYTLFKLYIEEQGETSKSLQFSEEFLQYIDLDTIGRKQFLRAYCNSDNFLALSAALEPLQTNNPRIYHSYRTQLKCILQEDPIIFGSLIKDSSEQTIVRFIKIFPIIEYKEMIDVAKRNALKELAELKGSEGNKNRRQLLSESLKLWNTQAKMRVLPQLLNLSLGLVPYTFKN